VSLWATERIDNIVLYCLRQQFFGNDGCNTDKFHIVTAAGVDSNVWTDPKRRILQAEATDPPVPQGTLVKLLTWTAKEDAATKVLG
jgi:hypothetical protein